MVKFSEKKKQEEKEKNAKGEPAPESLVTWIFQDDFIPRAKITKDGCYSIMTDYLGTLLGAYDEAGNLVWERELDINGKIIPSGKDSYGRRLKEVGEKTFIPFRFQGQYEDEETGLYYNRFRYYDPETGQYTQQDPIGLAGGNPTLYGYVYNTLDEIDPFGLHEILADSDLVVRGGTCTAETFKKGSGIAQDSITGKLTGISTQAKPGAELKTLANPFPHNQVGVATVGDIERAGGIITLDGQLNFTSGKMVKNHATVDGLTPEQAEKLFNPTQKNPCH